MKINDRVYVIDGMLCLNNANATQRGIGRGTACDLLGYGATRSDGQVRLVDRPIQLICISDIYLTIIVVNRQIQKT